MDQIKKVLFSVKLNAIAVFPAKSKSIGFLRL